MAEHCGRDQSSHAEKSELPNLPPNFPTIQTTRSRTLFEAWRLAADEHRRRGQKSKPHLATIA